MDIDGDRDIDLPSLAAEYASCMLTSVTSFARETQPASMLSKRESQRISMQKNEGKKRTCYSVSAVSIRRLQAPSGPVG